MATSVGSLRAFLSLDSAGFTKGAKSALGHLDSLKAGLATLGVGVSAGGFAWWIKHSIEAAKHLGDMSERTGIATDKLANLQRVAGLAGIETDELALGLEKMNVAMAKAAEGDPIAETFKRLKLSVVELLKLSPDKAFDKIADSMKGLSVAQRSLAAREIFGRGGVKFLTLLDQGSKGIAAQAKETKRFGLALSELDVAKLEIASDRFKDVSNIVAGLGQRIAVGLVTQLDIATDSITNFGSAGVSSARGVGGAFDFVTNGIMSTVQLLDQVNKGWIVFKKNAAELKLGAQMGAFGKLPQTLTTMVHGDQRNLIGLEIEGYDKLLNDINNRKSSVEVYAEKIAKIEIDMNEEAAKRVATKKALSKGTPAAAPMLTQEQLDALPYMPMGPLKRSSGPHYPLRYKSKSSLSPNNDLTGPITRDVFGNPIKENTEAVRDNTKAMGMFLRMIENKPDALSSYARLQNGIGR